ncbi:MAG TPA: SAM-dependent methyltransferase [Candidatus Binatia bacterium]|nr:SAM-dependent methyltransferase [Candidatus Binatia bacterium]
MSQVVEKIASEISSAGAIPFSRFMELALYCPVYGYYEAEKDILGRQGDYYTSVSVGPLFGGLLAAQLAEWLGQCGARNAGAGLSQTWSAKSINGSGAQREKDGGAQEPLHLVEAGAHRGELARDILTWMREHRPSLFQQMEYWIIEPSDRRHQWQQQTLAEFKAKLHWAKTLDELAVGTVPASAGPSVRGVIFSNELLDSFPVHRLGWDAHNRRWFEWGVTLNDGRFTWTRLSRDASGFTFDASRLPPPASRLPDFLPDAFTLELCPAAEDWWRQAAGVLQCGRLLTFDYGLTEEEFLVPERTEGTLRAYHRHQLVSDVLGLPGEQDITAQVNFTALQKAGECAGLVTEAFLSQSRFLTGIAARIWKGELAFGEWTPARARQFQTLTHPDHLGRAFRVLIQAHRSLTPPPARG